MADRQYEDGGALFPNKNKRNDKQPDYDGKITIDRDTAAYIFEQIKGGNANPTIKLAGWRRMGRNNTTFVSLKADIPWQDHPDNPQKGQARRGSPPPYQGKGGYAQARNEPDYARDMDDSIPF